MECAIGLLLLLDNVCSVKLHGSFRFYPGGRGWGMDIYTTGNVPTAVARPGWRSRKTIPFVHDPGVFVTVV